MKVRVVNISSISHQLMSDCVPCDRYIAFVCVHPVRTAGISRLYLRVYANTPAALHKLLRRYQTEYVLEVDENDLFNSQGEKYVTA